MSKLYLRYIKLKNINSNTIYLFKSGIFYIALADNAIKLSDQLGLHLTKLNDDIVKAGFPVKSRNYYVQLLNTLSIPFQFIDETYGIIDNYSDYYNNEDLKLIVNNILNVDLNNITFKNAFDILLDTQKKLQQIYPTSE